MKLLLVCFLMMLMIYGCPSSKEGGSTQTSNAQTVQEKVQAIDNVAWYVKFEKGSEDGDWQSMIRVDLGGITSKTFTFEDNTFEGVVNKTWVKCKEL